MEKPGRAGGKPVQERSSARAFLTISISNLTFWCRVADFDMNAILRKYCRGATIARVVGAGLRPDAPAARGTDQTPFIFTGPRRDSELPD
jgi:hypothetical protein